MHTESIFELVIVGGGPAGLKAAIVASKKGIHGLLLEGSDLVGGQLSQLYPQKDIVDIPGIPSILAIEYVDQLMAEYNAGPHTIAIRKMHRVFDVIPQDKYVLLKTNFGDILALNVIISSGLGAYLPRKMKVPNEELNGVIYTIDDYRRFAHHTIVVLGGGDSALDGAKMLHKAGAKVYLVHRRDEFRGNPETIANIPEIIVKKPFVPVTVLGSKQKVTNLVIRHVDDNHEETLECDFIFVNFGFQPEKNGFNFERFGAGIKVSEDLVVKPHIFVIGDAAGYENKIRRLYPIDAEIDRVFAQF